MGIDEEQALKTALEAGGGNAAVIVPPRRPSRRKILRRRLRWSFEVTHRWPAFVLGLVLLAITTSGAVLLYLPEIDKVAHPSLYDTTRGTPIPATRALAIARRDPSHIKPASIRLYEGAWVVDGPTARHPDRQMHIDAATGRVLGFGNVQGGVLGWLANFHDCGLGCEGYAGYTSWLGHTVKVLGNDDLTVGGLVVGICGLLLGWLVISGLWLWWPSIKRFARGFLIRRRRGTYALNYDLHKVVGIAALPFLGMWALTGTGFEFKQVEQAWYAVMPGKRPPEYAAATSKPQKKAPLTIAQAQQAAQRRLPGAKVRAIYLPADKTGTYEFSMSDGYDARGHGIYQGDVDVDVDQFSGAPTITYPTAYRAHRPLGQSLWQDFQFAGHAGEPVGGWVRIVWLAFGLSPLLLAVTSVVTWWLRRRKRKERSRRRASSRPVTA